MDQSDSNPLEQRVLVLAPTGKDASLTASVLGEAGIACAICADMKALAQEVQAGAGAALVVEEVIAEDRGEPLANVLTSQPPWSDLPILVLTRQGADSATVAQTIRSFGNVTLLERPVRVAALVSSVRVALRTRQRQYQMRSILEERKHAEETLGEANKRKDEFLATLAHELRNPLAPICNSLHILRLSGRDDPTVERVSAMMERQVNHMVRLVDDLLEVSRITRGKIELRKESIELAAVIRNAVEASRPLIDANRHQLTITLPPDPVTFEGDGVRLAQVFANLLNNAAKYTDPGGQIWLSARQAQDDLVVSVRDSGVGIPGDLLPHVFDMFMQARRPGAQLSEGLGIGLTLVKNLVEMHDGKVEAFSEGPGKGSEFVVRLPAKCVSPTVPAGPANLKPAAILAPCRVLIVDDNRDAADSLGVLLKILGADAHVVYSGAQALAAIPTLRPDVVLLDIGMPGMNGFEVARQIRAHGDFKGLTLIALTGWGKEEDHRRSQEAGFDFHLTKPPDFVALKALLNSLA